MMAVHERFLGMDADGRSARDIAIALGVAPRTVTRWRRATGRLKREPSRPATPEQLARALQLLEDGASRAEAARSVGLCSKTLRERWPQYCWTSEQASEYAVLNRRLAI